MRMFNPFVRFFLLAACLLAAGCNRGLPPYAVQVSGAERAVTGQVLSFSASANDVQGDSVSVRFSWGDGDTSLWSAYMRPRDDSATMTHAWADTGHYMVKAQARDRAGRRSDWLAGIRLIVFDSSIVRWISEVGPVWGTCPAVGPDSTIYVTAANRLVALSPNGTERWVLGDFDSYHSTPVVGADGTVYMQSYSWLVAIRPDGSSSWTDTLYGDYVWRHVVAIGPDGTIYTASNDTAVAIRPDGTAAWRTPLPGWPGYGPVVGTDSTICYVTTGDTDAACALAPDGSRKWTVSLPHPGWVSAGPSGAFYVCGAEVSAIKADGSVAWQHGGASCEGPAAAGADGRLLVPLQRGLLVVHPDLTTELALTDWGLGLSVLIDGEGNIIVPCKSGTYSNVFAILCLDGNLTSKWSLEADTEVLSTPGIGPDGTVYVGSTGGYLYAIKGKPLAVDAPWPKFGHDSRNSGCAAGH